LILQGLANGNDAVPGDGDVHDLMMPGGSIDNGSAAYK